MNFTHSQTFGSGKPLALVHGWAMHSGIWRDFALSLAEQYRVTCLDLPGHGRSRKISSFTLPMVADALVAAGPEIPSWWLGWSLGASVVLELARRHPERVRGVILLAGNPHFTQGDDWPGVKPALLSQFAGYLTTDYQTALTRFLALQVNNLPDGKRLLKTLKAALAECPAPDSESLWGGLEILQHADLRPVLTDSTKPTLVVAGNLDPLVPVAVMPRLAALSNTVTAHVIERAGHVPFLSHPRELQAVIREFMDSH